MSEGGVGWIRPVFNESRSDPRVGTEMPVDVFSDQFSGPLRATSRDVSVGGVCISTRSPIAYLSIRQVALHLPSGVLKLRAVGRWQQWRRASGEVLTGIAFQDLTAVTQDLLWDHVLDVGKELARFLFRHSDIRDIGIDGAMGLAQASRLQVFAPGEVVYRQGEAQEIPSSIYVLREGSVVLRARVRSAIERDFAVVKPGEFFGGLPMLANVEHHETAIARTATRLIELDERAYSYLLRSRPWVAQKLAFAVTRAYALRLRDTLETIEANA